MSDMIMRDAETGRAAFMSANEDAWHRLGIVTAGAQTPADALRIAHLNDWDVRTQPLVVPAQITLDGVTPEIAIPDHFAVVRTDPFDRSKVVPLGVVGDRYTPYQNEQLVQFLTDVVEQGGAVIETAGALGNGERVFFSMRLPKDVLIGGRDLSQHYITVLAGHDGNFAIRVLVTTVRVICGNTWQAALGNNVASFVMRHTASISTRVDQARRVLAVSWDKLTDFDRAMQRLVETELTRAAFNEIIADLWPDTTAQAKTPTSAARSATIRANRTQELNGLLAGATNADIRGTAYAGLMAITEYLDHPNGKDADISALRVATSAEVQATKDKALTKILALV